VGEEPVCGSLEHPVAANQSNIALEMYAEKVLLIVAPRCAQL
jgi:hypothetical protein